MADKEFQVRHGLIVANNMLVVSNNKVSIGSNTANVSLQVVGTDALSIPIGNTGQRPTGANGYVRFNSELNIYECYMAGSWQPFGGTQASANVSGPGSSTNNALVLFDGTTGSTVKNSLITVNANSKLITVASNSSTAGLRIQQGTAPSSLENGDIWITNADLFYRLNSATYTAMPKEGGTMTGRIVSSAGVATLNSAMANNTGSLGELEIKNNGTGAAMIAFNRSGSFAAYLGIDTDNQLKIGGWSFGNNSYKVWHANNDGSGSGLDADLLDGQDSTYYTAIATRLGYTPVQQGTGTGQLTNAVKIGWSANSVIRIQVDSTDFGPNWPINITGSSSTATAATTALTANNATNFNGQSASYYTDIVSRLGYQPVNKTSGDTIANTMVFQSQAGKGTGTIATGNGWILECQGAGGANAAYMLFHRPLSAAYFFGLDTDNQFKYGGFSAGAASYKFWTEQNLPMPIANVSTITASGSPSQFIYAVTANISATGLLRIYLYHADSPGGLGGGGDGGGE